MTTAIAGVLLAIAAIAAPPAHIARSEAESVPKSHLEWTPERVESRIREVFPDAPVMVEIARAESRFIEKAKNPHSSASGVFQILNGTFKACHGDVFDAEDNIQCARLLYDQSGTTPWLASKEAWGPDI